MSEVKLGSWSVAESPVTIEYSMVVIEEIRREVTQGYQRLSRGGIEVGGVLYGTREGRTVRIMAMRPISCEHARGPAFLLSDKDRTELHDQLVNDSKDPSLEGMSSVGWFLSHTRTEILLSDSDLETYSIFFPAPWQVALVVRPGRGSSMKGGFFVREADGTVKNEHSYLEFDFPDRLAGVLDRSPDRPHRERNPDRRPASSPPEPSSRPSFQREPFHSSSAPAASDEESLETVPGHAAGAPRRRKWLWLAAWAIAVLAAGYVAAHAWILHTNAASEPISLAIAERDGQLQIEWNHDAAPVESATDGSLEIIDGGDTQTVSLTRQMLTHGRFTYMRKTGDVEVRMTVNQASGAKVEEASRFLGRPLSGAAASGDPAAQKSRDELEAELARLREENGNQAARIRQLERTLRILETRLGIEQGKQP